VCLFPRQAGPARARCHQANLAAVVDLAAAARHGRAVATQVDILKDKVGRYVGDLIGPYEVDGAGDVHFRWGSSHVFVRCAGFGEDLSLVLVSVPLLFGVPASPELFRHVALHADDWYFGHLSATEQDGGQVKLWLSHALLGDYLDVEELKAAVAAVCRTADGLDDELKAKFGGVRYHEG